VLSRNGIGRPPETRQRRAARDGVLGLVHELQRNRRGRLQLGGQRVVNGRAEHDHAGRPAGLLTEALQQRPVGRAPVTARHRFDRDQ
jgi:hypothetical protein